MTAKKERETEAIGFSDALVELESILERIDSEEVDVDRLAAELRRAAELLELCREKIRAADLEVTQIVQRLEEAGEAGEAEQADADVDAGAADEDESEKIPF